MLPRRMHNNVLSPYSISMMLQADVDVRHLIVIRNQMCAFCIRLATHLSFFFFQAEDGIRDLIVTGVQTCALPICFPDAKLAPRSGIERTRLQQWLCFIGTELHKGLFVPLFDKKAPEGTAANTLAKEIGRASCREECRSRWSPYH